MCDAVVIEHTWPQAICRWQWWPWENECMLPVQWTLNLTNLYLAKSLIWRTILFSPAKVTVLKIYGTEPWYNKCLVNTNITRKPKSTSIWPINVNTWQKMKAEQTNSDENPQPESQNSAFNGTKIALRGNKNCIDCVTKVVCVNGH